VHATTGGVLVALLVAGTPFAVTAIDQRPDRPNVTTTAGPSPSTESSPTPSPSADTGPTPTPGPTGSTTPATEVPEEPTSVPPAAMLQESDVPGFAQRTPEHDGDGSFASTTIYCPDGGPSLATGAIAERERTFTDGTAAISERVDRHETVGSAQNYLVRVRAAVAHCDPGAGIVQAIVSEGFVLDDALLIATEVEGVRSLHVFVRKGPLVAEIQPADRTDRAAARALAERAAERLCAGTNAC
jgi:hypothetical protein